MAVRYDAKGGTQHFAVREITEDQWKRAGVEDQKTVVWNKANDFTVQSSELSDAAMKVIGADPELVEVDDTED